MPQIIIALILQVRLPHMIAFYATLNETCVIKKMEIALLVNLQQIIIELYLIVIALTDISIYFKLEIHLHMIV